MFSQVREEKTSVVFPYPFFVFIIRTSKAHTLKFQKGEDELKYSYYFIHRILERNII